jgi:hypothetical protein
VVQYKSSGLAMVTRTWRTAHTFQNTPVPPGTASVFYFPSDDIPLRPGSASAPLRGRVVPPPAASRRRPEAGTRASPTPVLRYGAARAAGGLP